MAPLKSSKPTSVGPEWYLLKSLNCSWSTSKDFKITIMNMLKVFKDDMNKSIDEVYENTKK